jgi:hypothetical protein
MERLSFVCGFFVLRSGFSAIMANFRGDKTPFLFWGVVCRKLFCYVFRNCFMLTLFQACVIICRQVEGGDWFRTMP